MTRQALKWWLIGAMVILALHFLGACQPMALPQEIVVKPYRIVLVDSLQSGEGVTGCDQFGVTQVSILKGIVDTPDYAVVMVHELTHVRQMSRWEVVTRKSCEDYLSKYRSDPSFRLTNEAQAYCKGFTVEATDGDWKSLVPNVVSFLSRNYKLSFPDTLIERRVREECEKIFPP